MPRPSIRLSVIFLIPLFLLGCRSFVNVVKPKTTFWNGKNLGPATFSPDESEIVFSVEEKRERTSHIFKAKVDGTGLDRLSRSSTYDHQAVFSPDGTYIAYSSIIDGTQADIILMKSDGSGMRSLTSGDVDDSCPVFSPDGRKVFFVRSEYFGNYSPIARKSWHESSIFLINTDGTELKRITEERYYRVSALSISSDSRTLVAAIRDGRNLYSVWTLPIDNPAERRPFKPSFNGKKIRYREMLDPELSSDGRYLLFSLPTNQGGIFVTDLRSDETRLLRYKEQHVYYPHFSKNGSQIIFRKDSYTGLFKTIEESKYFIVNTDGTDLKAINFYSNSANPLLPYGH